MVLRRNSNMADLDENKKMTRMKMKKKSGAAGKGKRMIERRSIKE